MIVLAIVLAIDGCDILTSVSGSAACLGNVGPALGDLGPSSTYAMLSAPTKIIMSAAMIAGRLELYTIFVLFSRRYWNPHRI